MDTYTLAVVVEEGLELDDVRVTHNAHDLQLAVLCWSQYAVRVCCSALPRAAGRDWTHLEALVLQHPLDGCVLAAGRQLRLEDDAERAVADNLALCVRQVLVVARLAVLHFLANDFWRLC